MGSKNKSVSSNEKSQGGKIKKDKKEHTEKKDTEVFINEEQANKIVKSSKVITNSRFSQTDKCKNFYCQCIS